jgi:hypothetical protein
MGIEWQNTMFLTTMSSVQQRAVLHALSALRANKRNSPYHVFQTNLSAQEFPYSICV